MLLDHNVQVGNQKVVFPISYTCRMSSELGGETFQQSNDNDDLTLAETEPYHYPPFLPMSYKHGDFLPFIEH